MSDFFQLFAKNAHTFYRIRQDGSREQQGLYFRYILILFLSIFISFLSNADNDNIMIGIITAQSIIMGFAFSVLVYISSQDALKIDASKFRETKKKALDLNTLAEEIFVNISYFIVLTVYSILISIMWIAVKSGSIVVDFVQSIHLSNDFHIIAIVIVRSSSFTMKMLMFFLAIESFAVFLRLVRRIIYHFDERKKLLNR